MSNSLKDFMAFINDHPLGVALKVFAATAYVERVSFVRTSPPTNRASGVGGIGQVLLRLV